MMARIKAAWAAFRDPDHRDCDILEQDREYWCRAVSDAHETLREVLDAKTLWAAQDAARKGLGE